MSLVRRSDYMDVTAARWIEVRTQDVGSCLSAALVTYMAFWFLGSTGRCLVCTGRLGRFNPRVGDLQGRALVSVTLWRPCGSVDIKGLLKKFDV